jgi:ABC-type phosphate transport system substrate-binding protein
VNNDILTYNQDFDNLTRTQAINLFAGNINNWTKLPGFDSADAANLGVQICLRHAGSGTHATLDKAVFRGDANIKKTAVTIGTAAKAYFFQSSSSTKTAEPGMLQCIESNGNRTSGYVAVGYLDADAVDDDMLQLKYQGVAATSENIIKGAYDFWSQQTLYALNNTNAVKSLTGYASTDIPNSKEGVWVPAADLKVTKSTDESIPTNF